MSARDELLSIASQDMPVTGAEVNDAIDAFAHELAESIRDAIGREDYPGENERSRSVVLGFRMAAEVIDPLKETK